MARTSGRAAWLVRGVLACVFAVVASACAGGQARALTVTYDLSSNQGPITLRFDADDAAADTRLRFRRGQADVSSLLDIALIVGGNEYTLIGAVDPDTGLLDRRARTLAFTVAEVVRPMSGTLTTVNLTFSASMYQIRTLGDLFAYLETAAIIGGTLTVDAADAAVPLPAAAWLFAGGAAGLARLRVRAVRARGCTLA